MKPYYVILTGSKNNAGDFLIKYRAKALLQAIRPDRDIVDYNNWEAFDEEKLEVVNKAQALIIMGGPAVRINMRPNLFPMVKDLSQIKVPILTLGAGWKSTSGTWEDTHTYPFNEATVKFLKRINDSGFSSGVRDYHTLNSLLYRGFDKFLMTGCPAYYDLDYLNSTPEIPAEVNKISFSLGVAFTDSEAMKDLMQKTILELDRAYKEKDFKVVFHHNTDPEYYKDMGERKREYAKKQNDFLNWIKANNIDWEDISGSAENLMNHYRSRDLHMGFRVHAHIFMASISKPTILIAEDGRGTGLRDTLGGIVYDGFNNYKTTLPIAEKVMNKFISPVDRYEPNYYLAKDLINNVDYELANGFPRIVKHIRSVIDTKFSVMKNYLEQLP